MMQNRIFQLSILTLLTFSGYSQNWNCQSTNDVTQPTRGGFTLPNGACNGDSCKPQPYQGGLSCKFTVHVKVGYFATLRARGKLGKMDSFATSIAGTDIIYMNSIDLDTWLAPANGSFLLITAKNTTGNLYIEITWTKIPTNSYSKIAIKGGQEAILMYDMFLIAQPFVIIAEKNKTVSVSMVPYNVPFNQQRLQAIFFFDGPDITSPFLTTGFTSFVNSQMVRSTQEYLTIYKVLAVKNDAYVLIHPTENVDDVAYYDGIWHTDEDVQVTLDATLGKAVFTTYSGEDPEYLTDLRFSDKTATLEVVSTTPNKEYGSNFIEAYNKDTAQTHLPQEVWARLKSYILDKGTANFTIKSDPNLANWYQPFDGRSGVLTTYVNNDLLALQPNTSVSIHMESPGPDPRPMYKFNVVFSGGFLDKNEAVTVQIQVAENNKLITQSFFGNLTGQKFAATGYALNVTQPLTDNRNLSQFRMQFSLQEDKSTLSRNRLNTLLFLVVIYNLFIFCYDDMCLLR